jgi:methyltransferase
MSVVDVVVSIANVVAADVITPEQRAALGEGVDQRIFGSVYILMLVVMAMARIIELLVAKRLTARAATRGAAPKPEPVFVVMVVLHILPFVLGPAEYWWRRPHIPGPLLAGSCAALLVLLGLRVWTLSTLGTRWNVRIVEPDAVVVAGPYRFIRHPNYAIVIAELFFMPLAGACFFTLVVVSTLNALVLFSRIRAEERVLFALPGYAEKMGPKKRFIPGVF